MSETIEQYIRIAIHRMRYAISESYRIQSGGGIRPIRNQRELDALINFCRSELKNVDYMRLNPDRKKIYQMTVDLYDQEHSDDINIAYKTLSIKLDHYSKPMHYNDVIDFICDHVNWYWS